MNNQYTYEKIDHSDAHHFNCFVESLESSCPHWHNDYEFIFLLKGSFCVRIEEKKYNAKTGDLILVNSRKVHSILDCEKGNIALFIQFSPVVLLQLLGLENRRFDFYLNSCNDEINIYKNIDYFKELVLRIGLILVEKKDGYAFYSHSKFYQLLGDLMSYTIYDTYYNNEDNTFDEDTIMLDKLTNYLRKNYREDLTADDICSFLGVSRSTLYRYMKKKIGLSLKSFINYFRIEKAKKLLLSTNYNISDIAGLCGYSNQPTFYRAFEKELDMTPNEFREKKEIKDNEDNEEIRGYVSYNQDEAFGLIKKHLEMH